MSSGAQYLGIGLFVRFKLCTSHLYNHTYTFRQHQSISQCETVARPAYVVPLTSHSSQK